MEVYHLFYFPLILFVFYTGYSILKKQSESDEFFYLHKDLSQDALIRRIEILELKHKREFLPSKEKIIRYFQDGILSNKELENLEEIITRAYFNGFYKKWAVFKESDNLDRVIFLCFIFSGFLVTGIILTYVQTRHPDLSDLSFGLLGALVFFPFSYIMILLHIGFFSFLLSIFRFILPKRGSLLRITILSEEYVKALKPGGRSTRIVLPSSRFLPGGPGF